jgi:Spy/CpxP family protein refolding chaperone
MANARLIEVAIKGLEAERARIEQELTELRNQRDGRAAPARRAPSTRRKRSGLTPEGRKRLSELARKRWAKSRRLGKTTL